MEKLLEQNALEICGEPDRFLGEKMRIAELQISTHLPSAVEAQLSGHGNSRKDIAKFYNKKPKGNVFHTKLFEEVKNRLAKISNKGFTSASKEKFLKRHENLVVISGQPGIGKSTLTKRLVYEMWKSKLYNPDIVFFIQFRAVNYKRKSDLLVFLAPFVETSFPCQSERREILKQIHKLKNVYIIMDGFDEALINSAMNQPRTFDICAENNAAGFVQNLIEGNILPLSKKMITSRPRAIAQLPEDFQPKVLFTIQGLDEAGLKQICFNICSQNNARCNKILNYLNNHPDFKSFSHTPVLCIMVMEDLAWTISRMEDNLLDNLQENNHHTITSMFVSIFKRWLKEKQRTRFPLKNIAAFAFKKFRNGEFYFRDYELRRAAVDDQNTSTFFNIFLKGAKMLYFVHLMWQEFLVAVHLRLFTTKEEFTSVPNDQQRKIVTELKSKKYEVVAAFLFGLCNKNTLDNLLDCIEEQNTARHLDECKVMLQDFATEMLQKDSKAIVSIIKWIYENSEHSFVHNAAVCLKGYLRIDNHRILPGDTPIISYFLRTCDVDLKLEVINPRFVGNCYCDFYKELHTTLIQNQKIKVR